MGKVLLGVLLAGVAAPALAAGGPHDRHHDDDSNARQENRAERPSRGGGDEARPQADRSARPERPVEIQRPQFNGERPQFNGERPQFAGRPQFNSARPEFAGRPQSNWQRPQSADEGERSRPVMRDNPYVQAPDTVRNWRPREQTAQPRDYYQQRRVRVEGDTNDRRDVQRRFEGREWVSGVPRQGTQPPVRYDRHRDGGTHWNTDWRHDRRYDWRDRRRHHHSLFHIGLYIDPFGWGYQPFSVGWRLWPNYYQQNYWIDPGMYGLPYPPPGMQWVRYWNDALLVDTYTGEVVDSIQGFFW